MADEKDKKRKKKAAKTVATPLSDDVVKQYKGILAQVSVDGTN
jgi:hypothetical protein